MLFLIPTLPPQSQASRRQRKGARVESRLRDGHMIAQDGA